ncbi:hypothetical protein ACOSP7_015287 [Xanthoceras sorbifolium]
MASLKQQIAEMRQSFFDEELLDKYFIQLEQLADLDNPDFVEDVLTLFFRDSTQLLSTIEEDMEKIPLDYVTLDRNLHQLKGSSASVGANKIKIEVNQTREHLKEGNLEGAKASFEQLKKEHSTLKTKLNNYFQLVNQVGPTGPGTSASA